MNIIIQLSFSYSQEKMDVIYLKSGSKAIGKILSKEEGQSVVLRIQSNESITIQWDDIKEIGELMFEQKQPFLQNENHPSHIPAPSEIVPVQEPQYPKDSWYTYVGISLISNKYFGNVDGWLNRLLYGEKTKYGIEFPSLYFPMNNQHTAIGIYGVFSLESKSYSTSDKFFNPMGVFNPMYIISDEKITIYTVRVTQYLIGVSAMHFFDWYIGHGLFVKLDLGYTSMSKTDTYMNISENQGGVGVVTGGGISFPIQDYHIFLSLNYSMRIYSGSNISIVGLSVGALY